MSESSLDTLTDPAVRAAADDALARLAPAGTPPYAGIAIVLAKLAHEAYKRGRLTGVRDLRTTSDVMEATGLSRTHLLKYAKTHDLGWQAGNERLFTSEDVAAIEARPRRWPAPPPAG